MRQRAWNSLDKDGSHRLLGNSDRSTESPDTIQLTAKPRDFIRCKLNTNPDISTSSSGE